MEKKLTDEEIVKVLDKCFAKKGEMSCKDCKVYTGEGLRDCMKNVAIPALDFINRQKAEIERLTKLAELRKRDNDDTSKLLFKEEDKNAELQKQVDKVWFEVGKMCMEERKETAEKFAEMLKQPPYKDFTEEWVADEILKEITEEVK